MAYNRNGYRIRAKTIQEITKLHYEPERQDRCYKAVWRRHIKPLYGIGYMTYLRYLKEELPSPGNEKHAESGQLSLFRKDGK